MPKTLLLADDSVTIQKVVGISFANEDVTLITVDNGDDAFAKAREVRPDVILADVVMPGMSGYEVCQAVKSDPTLAHIPVLLLTGTFEAFDDARAAQCGAAGHVAKPFEAQALVERVKELLARAPAPAPATPPPGATPQTTAPEASTRPRPAPAPASDEGFDFFDEDVAELAAPSEPAAASTPDDDEGLDLGGGAFAFGDEELGGEEAAPLAAPALDHTVALLGDVEPSHADRGGDATRIDPEFAVGDADPGDDLLSHSSPGSDVFDFDLGGEDDAPLSTSEIAQETVLDPKGASGFAISSSELDPPADAMAALDPGPGAPAGDELVVTPEPELAPVAASAEPDLEAPLLSAAELDESSLEQLVEATPEPDLVPHSAPPEAPVLASEARATDLPAHDPAALAGAALAEITPRLREQLHDTLEKIAWESLGDVAEQIVRQAVERVEKVAWEVVPQMAETLVKEEIRKMKGEG